MPRPMFKSRSKKQRQCSLPGGSNKVVYKKEKTCSPKCSNCGRTLNSASHSTSKIRKLPKTQKKISRLYGGQLCHICLRTMLKKAAKAL